MGLMAALALGSELLGAALLTAEAKVGQGWNAAAGHLLGDLMRVEMVWRALRACLIDDSWRLAKVGQI